MRLDEAYRAYSKPLLRYAGKLGSHDPESLVHDAFLSAAQCEQPITAYYSWLKLAMRRAHWKSLRHDNFELVIDDYQDARQHDLALLSQIDSFLDGFGGEYKECFTSRMAGFENAEIGKKMGLTAQGVSARIVRMKRDIMRNFNDPVIEKARELCVASHDWGDALRRGILGGQCDKGTLVQQFVPEAEKELKHV